MQLILLRHGKAEDHHADGDYGRRLVEKGISQARRAARFLESADRLPDVVLTSPRVRARETAEHFCEELGLADPLHQPWLDCGMNADAAWRELQAFSEFERVMIVGHEPDFSSLVEWLLGCSGGAVEVKKGSLVGVEIFPPSRRARLLFALPPKMIRG